MLLINYPSDTPIVVMTGGSGFLGRHVAEHLVSAGLHVIPVARRNVPWAVQIEDYRNSPDGDILVHLAEEPNRVEVNRRGESYIQQSAALLNDLVERFGRNTLYASSGVVYGDQNEAPCSIDMPVIEADTYSRSKLLNERIVLEAGGCVVRLSNLFGSGMAANNVMSDIMRQVPGEGSLRVRDNAPVRDFLPVTDAAAAFGLIVSEGFRGIVNVGSGVGTSVRTLAEIALRGAGQQYREIVSTAPSLRRSVNVLDISATRKLLGWSPTDPIRQLSDFLAQR
jgi:UDP-glucose 4-epimerase